MLDVEAALREKATGRSGHWEYRPLFASFERGEIGPMGFFRTLCIVLDCSRRIDYYTFANLWTDIWNRENEELDKLLTQFSPKKYLLSNTNRLIYERCITTCAIVKNNFPLREQHILSCDVGAIKPNPLIYKIALAQAKAKPEESLFIDDTPENIEAWRALGGVGIVYDANKDSMKKLKQHLRAVGVLS